MKLGSLLSFHGDFTSLTRRNHTLELTGRNKVP